MTMDEIVSLPMDAPIWHNFFTVAPLILVASMGPDGSHNIAPKHMAMPMSWQNYFGFVCSPSHTTYQNIKRDGSFTVTYPRPSQVLLTSLAATPRTEDDVKPSLAWLPTFPASQVKAPFVQDGYIFLECTGARTVDKLGENSLILARIVAAHVHQDALRRPDRDDAELLEQTPLLAYLEPGRFARIKKTHEFPFPTDFKR
jgi:flavin reductase (DIM6/NTAB) family NADH-FMN oxidoreductase RutF